MTALELGAVMAYFEDHQDAPPGYEIAAIDWSAPKRSGRWVTRRAGPKEGADAMRDHFYYVLRGRLTSVRVGSVKR